ncbi:MAG TPA: ATP-binding protein [Pyrinomonadaceae bacterium]|jgi:signal transduction histidine kinase/FixJ family two-component response regulator|nr:ATP-binding protein [Pyrinomonadaceae bacterium]
MRLIQAKSIQQVEYAPLTPSDQVLARCTIAREKLELGDYDAGCASLQPWWTIGEWPKQEGLSQLAAAELLLTAGTLSGWVASTRHVDGGQNCAERLLSGAVALFDNLGDTARSGEGRAELGYCYYRQGLFDLARGALRSSLNDLTDRETELKGIVMIRLATLERHASRLHDAVSLLNEADRLTDYLSPWTKGRFHLEFATTLKDLGIAENRSEYFDSALDHYRDAFSHFEGIGNHRYTAIVENNHGYLLSALRRFDEAQLHLQRARKLFEELGDQVRRAQVDETLAQLYLASEQYGLAQRAVCRAVETMETSGEEALLAEALTTHGLVLCKLGRRHEAKPLLLRARRVAERCGDYEGAGRPLLILIEEMCDQLGEDERQEFGAQASQLLANSQQATTCDRLRNCLERIAAAHAEYEELRERATHAEKMAALGELSFGVAHNVNNTLTGILGRAQLLLRTKDAEKISTGIEMIIKSAEDGAHIIRRIQDFARKQPSRKFQSVSVAGLMKDVCEMSRPRWEARASGPPIRVALVADCTASVMGDAVELREVLVNMIYNAIDAMPSGGEIRMSSQENSGRVVLTIADSGTGMTPEVKSRLFDPFFTTKGKGGTGMGMAVSFGIIRRHNGSIDVESEPGRGTTFRISLPVAPEVLTNAETDLENQYTSSEGDKLRVLVVDDESAVREVLREALEAEGCEVIVADSGERALRLYDARAGSIDLVFTDIGMPEMSGWELSSEIRKRSETIPLAIVSGWADAISVDARQAIKADWVVSKPFDIGTIAEIANEVAARRKGLEDPSPELANKDVRALLGIN